MTKQERLNMIREIVARRNAAIAIPAVVETPVVETPAVAETPAPADVETVAVVETVAQNETVFEVKSVDEVDRLLAELDELEKEMESIGGFKIHDADWDNMEGERQAKMCRAEEIYTELKP